MLSQSELETNEKKLCLQNQNWEIYLRTYQAQNNFPPKLYTACSSNIVWSHFDKFPIVDGCVQWCKSFPQLQTKRD